MSIEEARSAVAMALTELRKEDSQKRLRDILKECDAVSDPMQQFQLKMSRLIPAVTEVMGPAFGGKNVMTAVFEIQAHAASDPQIAVAVGKMMKAISGDLSALNEADEEFEEVE